MSVAETVLTFVGGGAAGSALTYGLTWSREHRRTIDAYGAPQRDAIDGIIAATHELLLRESDFRQAINDLANESEGKPHRKYSDQDLDEVSNQLGRALLGIDKAFNVGRFTIVEADCYEAMGVAYNEFMKIKDEFAGFEEMEQTPDNMRQVTSKLAAYARQLNIDVADLVLAGQRRVSPVQSWRNKRRREEVRKRLEAKYFKPNGRPG